MRATDDPRRPDMLLMPLLMGNFLLAAVGAAPTAPASATQKHEPAADGLDRGVGGGGILSSHPSSYFTGSQILSVEQGSALNTLAGFGAKCNWTMCYSSFTNDSSTPDVYHKQCDQYNKTLHVVVNHVAGVPRVFGGFAVRAPPHCSLLTQAHIPSQELRLDLSVTLCAN